MGTAADDAVGATGATPAAGKRVGAVGAMPSCAAAGVCSQTAATVMARACSACEKFQYAGEHLAMQNRSQLKDLTPT
jgi:hypothetical protein